MPHAEFFQGDARAVLAGMPSSSVNCVVTSPPYYGLRDYGVDGQIGLEASPDAYVAEMVALFREARRVLRDDGTLWLNIGDSYANGGRSTRAPDDKSGGREMAVRPADGAKPKDLLMIPARVALALQADGWYLRSEVVWAKPNPMPESVKDRPTSAHEKVFLFAKRPAYFYDAAAVAEASVYSGPPKPGRQAQTAQTGLAVHSGKLGVGGADGKRNLRNVWTITPKPFRGAHFAVMPVELAERCIKAGSRPGDTVLDPFGGAGTTAAAAQNLGRNSISIELNPDYIRLAQERLGLLGKAA